MLPGQRTKRRIAAKKLEFSCLYGSRTIRYNIWLSEETTLVDTVVFLGTVQVGKLPSWLAHRCPAGVAVVQGAPHWLAKSDGSDLFEFMRQFTENAFTNILRMNRSDKLRILVDSQATPNVLEFLARSGHAKAVASLVLIQPLGLNPEVYGKEDRIAIFKKRVTNNFRHQLPFLAIDRRLVYNHRQILRTVGYNNPKSDSQYNAGLTSSGNGYLRKLYKTHVPIAVVCGQKDELFPPHEIRDNLRENDLDIPVLVVPNVPHSPLASKQGMRLFLRALGLS